MGGITLAAALLGGGGSGVSVSVSPPSASGGNIAGGFVPAVTAIPAGGNGAFTFAWTVIQHDLNSLVTINSPAAATTSFTFEPVAPGDGAFARVRVTITSGGQSASAEVDVSFLNTSQPGGVIGGGGGGGQFEGSI
jgi:hypothetical protein